MRCYILLSSVFKQVVSPCEIATCIVCTPPESNSGARGLQVAERKHKPTVLEFMEPLIDQTVPGTVEEEYMVLPFAFFAGFARMSARDAYAVLPSASQLSFAPRVEVSLGCICHRSSSTTRCTGGSAYASSRGSTFRCEDWPSRDDMHCAILVCLHDVEHAVSHGPECQHRRCSRKLRQPTTSRSRLGSCTRTNVRRSRSLNLSRSPPLWLRQPRQPSPSRHRQARRRRSRSARRTCRTHYRQRLPLTRLTMVQDLHQNLWQQRRTLQTMQPLLPESNCVLMWAQRRSASQLCLHDASKT